MKITTKTTLSAIVEQLREDGYAEPLLDRDAGRFALVKPSQQRAVDERALRGGARDIKRAALRGCLLWSSSRLTTTDVSRIDVRPDASVDFAAYDRGEFAR